MIQTYKITTTAYNGGVIALPNQKAYLRISPFTTNSVTGVETSYGNYTFDVSATNYYKLYNGPSVTSLTENTAFAASTTGRLLFGNDFNPKNLTGTTSNIQTQINSLTSGGGTGSGSSYKYEILQMQSFASDQNLTLTAGDYEFWGKLQSGILLNDTAETRWDNFYKNKYWRFAFKLNGTSNSWHDYTELTKYSSETELVDAINSFCIFSGAILRIYVELYDKVDTSIKQPKTIRRGSLFSAMNGPGNWLKNGVDLNDGYEGFFASVSSSWTSELCQTFILMHKKLNPSFTASITGTIDNTIIGSTRSNKNNFAGHFKDGVTQAYISPFAYDIDEGNIVDVTHEEGTTQLPFIFYYNTKANSFNCFGYSGSDVVYYNAASLGDHESIYSIMLNSENVLVFPILFRDNRAISFKYTFGNLDSFYFPTKDLNDDDVIELKLNYNKNSRYLKGMPFNASNEWIGYNLMTSGNIPEFKRIFSLNHRKIFKNIKFCVRQSNGNRSEWFPLFKLYKKLKYFPLRILAD